MILDYFGIAIRASRFFRVYDSKKMDAVMEIWLEFLILLEVEALNLNIISSETARQI